LFIVKETVSKVGGEITVSSRISEGTVFELRIPELPLVENGAAVP
jgi:chemotaxis protein histidine kinase CheA